MKIIIAGCGKVGYALAEQLNEEGHELTIIDINEEKERLVGNVLDVMHPGQCHQLSRTGGSRR